MSTNSELAIAKLIPFVIIMLKEDI